MDCAYTAPDEYPSNIHPIQRSLRLLFGKLCHGPDDVLVDGSEALTGRTSPYALCLPQAPLRRVQDDEQELASSTSHSPLRTIPTFDPDRPVGSDVWEMQPRTTDDNNGQ